MQTQPEMLWNKARLSGAVLDPARPYNANMPKGHTGYLFGTLW